MEEDLSNDDEFKISESSLFSEEEEVIRCLEVLSSSPDSRERNEALQRTRSVFDKYLECPTLLDGSVERIVNTLTCQIQNELNSLFKTDEREASNTEWIPKIQHALSALYALCKVRGRKCVQKFFPHGVEDIEPVWSGLQGLIQATKEETNATMSMEISPESLLPPLWESVYVLWNWMSVLSLVPFDYRVVVSEDDSFIQNLIELCKANLADAGPTREAASACLAYWLSRPDSDEQNQISKFVEWAQLAVNPYIGLTKKRMTGRNLFVMLGILQTCTTILKVSSIERDRLVTFLEPLWEPFLILAERPDITGDNLLLQKLLVKWWTRMSCAHLPPRVASWQYQLGKRSLLDNLKKNNEETANFEAKPTINREKPSDKDADLFYVPDKIEDAMGRIIEALSHASTIVRWSAAKGIGRITERLPSVCAEDVLDALLNFFEDPDKDRSWHGASLALAELARRGLLLPDRLGDVIPFIVRAIQYDIQRGQSSVGANVRDAACYTYWAFARAYSPAILRPYLHELSEAILVTSIFDREVNCRRAASAAFQEAVGRQGADNFEHGIEIITTADYFSLGNRNHSYLSIAPAIAKFKSYRKPIVNHLCYVKLYNWDENVRVLSSKALYELTSVDPVFLSGPVLTNLLENCLDEKNLFTRHGALLGVAEIVLAISVTGNTDMITKENRDNLTSLVSKIEKKRLYRGRGGEIMRSAVCRFIECLCSAKFALVVKDQLLLLDSVDANIPHPNEQIQNQACIALKAVMETYFPVSEKGPSARLQNRVVDKFLDKVIKSENPAAARGYALAIGFLPAKLLAPNENTLVSIIRCLCKTARYDALVGGEADAETRRNSLSSLVRIVKTVGLGSVPESKFPRVAMDPRLVVELCEAFLLALNDYKSDRRGDVGSWCKMVAMEGITTLLLTATEEESFDHTKLKQLSTEKPYATIAMSLFLKQLAEKLDTVRIRAGDCLARLILGSSNENWISEKIQVARLLEIDNLQHNRWEDPSFAFSRVMDVASLSEPLYFQNIIVGIASSIGCLTESVCLEATNSLLKWTKESGRDRLERLANYFAQLLKNHRGNVGLVLPLLKTIETLLVHKCLDPIVHSEESDFTGFCLRNLQDEEKQSHRKDVKRLFAIVDVTCALLAASPVRESDQKSALAFLCYMLTHPFPRIRSYCAEQFYLFLVEYQNKDKVDDHVLELLLNTPWTSEACDGRQPAANVACSLGVSSELNAMVSNDLVPASK